MWLLTTRVAAVGTLVTIVVRGSSGSAVGTSKPFRDESGPIQPTG
jgi:hypothetical protein